MNFRFPYCRQCRESFPMREEFYLEFERNGNTFYCQHGHRVCITQTSVSSMLHVAERRNEDHMKTVDRLRRREASLRGVQTRHLNRLLCGHCPYCNKSRFHDLIQHIKLYHTPKVT